MERYLTDADVLIIGGGPAGSTLGCLLAMGDRSAILIERSVHPREHVGELLTPSVNAVLHRIGLLPKVDTAGFVNRDGLGWTAPGAPNGRILTIPVSDYPAPRALRRYGFNVERDVFDAMLLEHARQLGVEVLERTTARRVVFEDDRALGVEIEQLDGGTRTLRGRFVVDATGRRTLLGSQVRLVEHDVMRRQCAMYARFQGVHLVQPALSGYAYLHVLNDLAWGWQIPLRNNVTSIGIVGPCGQFRRANTSSDMFFEGMIADNWIIKHAMGTSYRISPWIVVSDYSYRLRQLYGSGWLLIGDASGFVDPIFSSGVDIAMYSAVFAYESILPLLLLGCWSDADEGFALSKYEERLRQGVQVWTRAVELFYECGPRLGRLAHEQWVLPAICRFLQGNPYEVQNELIVNHLFDWVCQGTSQNAVVDRNASIQPSPTS